MIDYRLFGIKPSRIISSYCYSVFRLEPYLGCRYNCIYCYTQWYKPINPPITSNKLLYHWEKIARKISEAKVPKPYFRLSTLTEPFQESVEDKLLVSYKLLRIAYKHRIPIIINTKSTLFLKEPWFTLLNKMNDEKLILVQMSISIDDEELARLLEPGAPSPSKRYEALDRLSEHGIPAVLRLQPLIPGLGNEHLKVLDNVVNSIGGVIIESLRLPWNELKLLYSILSVKRDIVFDEKLWVKYTMEAENLYTPVRGWKEKIYREIHKMVSSRGIPLSTCKDYPVTMRSDCCLFWITGNREYGVRETIRERKYRVKLDNVRIIEREIYDRYPNPIRKILRLHSNKLDRVINSGREPLG